MTIPLRIITKNLYIYKGAVDDKEGAIRKTGEQNKRLISKYKEIRRFTLRIYVIFKM